MPLTALAQIPHPEGGMILIFSGPEARESGLFPDSTGLYLVTDSGCANLEECADPQAAREFAEAVAGGKRAWKVQRALMNRALVRDPARRHEDVLAAVAAQISPEFFAQKLKSLATAKKWVKTGAESYAEVMDASAIAAFVKLYADTFIGTPIPRVPVEGEQKQSLSLETLLEQREVRDLLLAKILALNGQEDSGNSGTA